MSMMPNLPFRAVNVRDPLTRAPSAPLGATLSETRASPLPDGLSRAASVPFAPTTWVPNARSGSQVRGTLSNGSAAGEPTNGVVPATEPVRTDAEVQQARTGTVPVPPVVSGSVGTS